MVLIFGRLPINDVSGLCFNSPSTQISSDSCSVAPRGTILRCDLQYLSSVNKLDLLVYIILDTDVPYYLNEFHVFS